MKNKPHKKFNRHATRAQRDAPPPLSDEERTHFAEVLRERIYSTITLLAVIVVLWEHASEHSAWGVIGTIAGTVGALWLATLIAARMSHQIMHESDQAVTRFGEAKDAASGLLMPAGVPILAVLISLTGIISLKTALLISLGSLLLSLFLFSVMSGRHLATSRWRLLIYSVLQMGLGLAVVALKLAVE